MHHSRECVAQPPSDANIEYRLTWSEQDASLRDGIARLGELVVRNHPRGHSLYADLRARQARLSQSRGAAAYGILTPTHTLRTLSLSEPAADSQRPAPMSVLASRFEHMTRGKYVRAFGAPTARTSDMPVVASVGGVLTGPAVPSARSWSGLQIVKWYGRPSRVDTSKAVGLAHA